MTTVPVLFQSVSLDLVDIPGHQHRLAAILTVMCGN